MKKNNQYLLLRLVYRMPGITRADIANALGLTRAAVSKQVSRLIEEGLLTEHVEGNTGKGGKARGLFVMDQGQRILVIKIARTRITYASFALSGSLVQAINYPISLHTNGETLVQGISDKIQMLLHNDPSICAVSLAVPGPYDVNQKKIISFSGLGDNGAVDFKPLFDNCSRPLFITHDANCGVMYCFMNSSEPRVDTTVYFLVGEGVGAGIISKGEVFLGEYGQTGEIGHVSIAFDGPYCSCGNRGCLELYASSIAFVRHVNLKLSSYPTSALNQYTSLSYADIFHEAEKRDDLALESCRYIAERIAIGMTNIIRTYDPGCIVFGGDLSAGGEPLLDLIKHNLSEVFSQEQLSRISFQIEDQEIDHILYGAASVAINESLANPEIITLKG